MTGGVLSRLIQRKARAFERFRQAVADRDSQAARAWWREYDYQHWRIIAVCEQEGLPTTG